MFPKFCMVLMVLVVSNQVVTVDSFYQTFPDANLKTSSTREDRSAIDHVGGINSAASIIFHNETDIGDGVPVDRSLSRGHLKFALSVYSAVAAEGEPDVNFAFSPVMLADFLTSALLSIDYSNYLSKHNVYDRIHKGPLYPSETLSSSAPSANEQEPQIISTISTNKEINVFRQLIKVLHFGNISQNAITSVQQNMQHYLLSYYLHSSLRTCTKHFRHRTLQAHQRYMFHRKEIFVDFQNSEIDAKQLINRALSRCSGGEVRGVLQAPPNIGTQHLVAGGAVLSNNWLNNFNTSLTFDNGLFYTSQNERLEIPVMVSRQLVPLGYFRLLETRVLELPLSGRRASLFILLPDHSTEGLANLERNLTDDTIRNLLATLQDEIVNIRLPRFSIGSSPPLRGALRRLGLAGLFREGADDPPLGGTLDDIVYKMVFEVSEAGRFQLPDDLNITDSQRQSEYHQDGTKTSSAIPVLRTFGEKHFQVDHPFLFFLWDYFHSYVVVMGRVTHPHPLLKA